MHTNTVSTDLVLGEQESAVCGQGFYVQLQLGILLCSLSAICLFIISSLKPTLRSDTNQIFDEFEFGRPNKA